MKLMLQDILFFVVLLEYVGQQFGVIIVLCDISLVILVWCMVGLIGLDGVGKLSLFLLIVGVWIIEQGNVMVFGGDMCDVYYCCEVCLKIVWMLQGLGKNFYYIFLVYENVDFFVCLFGYDKVECELCINELLQSIGLVLFCDCFVGKFFGGMK